MTTFDLIGHPFPKDAPIFIDNPKTTALIKKIESYVEISWDIIEIENYIETAFIFGKKPENINGEEPRTAQVCEALSISALILYARLFAFSQGRTKLESDLFKDAQDHDYFINYRSTFVAHQQSELNKHNLYYFKTKQSPGIQLNSDGYTTRTTTWKNLDWSKFKACVGEVRTHVESRISSTCLLLEQSLTQEQLDYLISLPNAP